MDFPGVRLHVHHIHRLGILIHQGVHEVAHQRLGETGPVNENARHGHLVDFILRAGHMDALRAEHSPLLVHNQALLLLALEHQLHRPWNSATSTVTLDVIRLMTLTLVMPEGGKLVVQLLCARNGLQIHGHGDVGSAERMAAAVQPHSADSLRTPA